MLTHARRKSSDSRIIVLANSWITCFSGTQIICHFWREIYCLRLQSAKCRDANLRLFAKKSHSHRFNLFEQIEPHLSFCWYKYYNRLSKNFQLITRRDYLNAVFLFTDLEYSGSPISRHKYSNLGIFIQSAASFPSHFACAFHNCKISSSFLTHKMFSEYYTS